MIGPTFSALVLAMSLTFEPQQSPPPAQSTAPASQPAAMIAPQTATGFLFKSLELDGETYNYSIYVPPEYKPDKPWPVILFLHGSGERGSDGLLQTEVGIGTAIRRSRARCPAIVVMPQCRQGDRWGDKMNAMALNCVEKTSTEYNLDPRRLYLTGLSLGGEGSWRIAAAFPRRFAAVAVICGFVGNPKEAPSAQMVAEVAGKLNATPLHIYHGGADKVVNVEQPRVLFKAIKAAGGPVEYIEYPEVDHNSWDRTYGDAKFWEWLLSQRLPATSDAKSEPKKDAKP